MFCFFGRDTDACIFYGEQDTMVVEAYTERHVLFGDFRFAGG